MPGCSSGCCTGTCTDGVEARNVPIGGACALGGCGEGEFCDVSAGVCRARVARGNSYASAICQAGLVCSNVSQTCVTPSPVGGSCLGSLCDGDGTCTATQTCARAPVVGDACNPGSCGLSLTCVNGVCTIPGAIGQACVGDPGSEQCQLGIVPAGVSETVPCMQGVCAYLDPAPAVIACLSP